MKTYSTIVLIAIVIYGLVYFLYIRKPYTFSAEVDGYSVEAWAATATYANDQLHILAGLEDPQGKAKRNMMYIYAIASKPGTYILSDDHRYNGGNNAGYASGDKLNRTNFITNSQYTGKIEITELDTTDKKVSGRFEFATVELLSGGYGTRVARITGGTFSDVPIKSELTLIDKK